MNLHERVFSIYVRCMILAAFVLVCIPLTIALRGEVVPRVIEFFAIGVPVAIAAMVADPLLAVTALLLVLFLWSGIMTVFGMPSEGSEEKGPSNHRRGRIVESRMSDDCEEILKERRATRSRNADDTMRDPAGFGRPNRYEFIDPFGDDDE